MMEVGQRTRPHEKKENQMSNTAKKMVAEGNGVPWAAMPKFRPHVHTETDEGVHTTWSDCEMTWCTWAGCTPAAQQEAVDKVKDCTPEVILADQDQWRVENSRGHVLFTCSDLETAEVLAELEQGNPHYTVTITHWVREVPGEYSPWVPAETETDLFDQLLDEEPVLFHWWNDDPSKAKTRRDLVMDLAARNAGHRVTTENPHPGVLMESTWEMGQPTAEQVASAREVISDAISSGHLKLAPTPTPEKTPVELLEDGWETPVDATRERELRVTSEQVLLELPEDIPVEDALDAVWMVLGALTADEEAICIARINQVLGTTLQKGAH